MPQHNFPFQLQIIVTYVADTRVLGRNGEKRKDSREL